MYSGGGRRRVGVCAAVVSGGASVLSELCGGGKVRAVPWRRKIGSKEMSKRVNAEGE